MWLVSSYMEYKATIQEGVMKFHLTHKEIHDDNGTFIVTFNGLLQCTMDYTNHVLHACSDRDTVTDSDLAATQCPTTGAYWEQRHL